MAAQAAEVRTDRLVVLLSKTEKAALTARARRADMTLSEYVRAAAERFDGEPSLPEDFEAEILHQIDQIKSRLQSTFDSLDSYLIDRREPDRDAIREQVFTELDKADVDWAEVRSVLGLDR